MSEIRSERRDDLMIITIANEAKHNAFTASMTNSLGSLLDEGEADPAVRGIVITGAGEAAFSSGHDLKEMLADPDHASDPTLNAPFVRPASMKTPTIAAINGYCFAAGFILALNCDFRVVSASATFCAPGARIGLLPVGGQLSRLPTLLPRTIAHELLVTCREFAAEEAHRLGFANRLVSTGSVLEAGCEMGRAIARNSSAVVGVIKEGLRTLEAEGEREAIEFEWHQAEVLREGPDAQEGISAFLEKRPARFQ